MLFADDLLLAGRFSSTCEKMMNVVLSQCVKDGTIVAMQKCHMQTFVFSKLSDREKNLGLSICDGRIVDDG